MEEKKQTHLGLYISNLFIRQANRGLNTYEPNQMKDAQIEIERIYRRLHDLYMRRQLLDQTVRYGKVNGQSRKEIKAAKKESFIVEAEIEKLDSELGRMFAKIGIPDHRKDPYLLPGLNSTCRKDIEEEIRAHRRQQRAHFVQQVDVNTSEAVNRATAHSKDEHTVGQEQGD